MAGMTRKYLERATGSCKMRRLSGMREKSQAGLRYLAEVWGLAGGAARALVNGRALTETSSP